MPRLESLINYAPPIDYGGTSPEIIYSLETLREIRDNFCQELQIAATAHLNKTGNSTSLPFYTDRFNLPPYPQVQEGELFQVLVLGGTDQVQAICRKSAGDIEIVEHSVKHPLPKMSTMDQLKQYLQDTIDPRVNVVAVNLANTFIQDFNGVKLDGIIPEFDDSRSLAVPELIGKTLGNEIESIINQTRTKPVSVSVAGDGYCQILTAHPQYPLENIAFGVVGTGYNMGFLLDKETFVNLDAATFNRFPMDNLTKELGEKFGWPFGKAVNGTHLYKHFNAALERKKIEFPAVNSTIELSVVSQNGIPEVSEIAQAYINRAAQLVACQASGLAEFKHRNMVFVMDGSVFWKGNNFAQTVIETSQKLTDKKIQFIQIPNVAIIGGAKLVV